MKPIGAYREYKIYEINEEDREITGSTGSRYIRNSLIIFRPNDSVHKLGNEWRCVSSAKEAKEVIEADTTKVSMQVQLKKAEARSKELEINECRKRDSEAEEARRRKEEQQSEYVRNME